MPLSALLCVCAFVLCCTGFLDRPARRLGVSTGAVAALSVLLLLLDAVTVVLGRVTVNLGFFLLLAAAAAQCRRASDAVAAIAFAAGTGVLGFFLARTLPAFPEPGLLAALPAALFVRFVFTRPRTALLAVAAAPLFFAVCGMLEETFLFDAATLVFCPASAVDAQRAGALLLLLSLLLQRRLRVPRPVRQGAG